MAPKIWLSLCLVLFAHNLISLISDCYSVNYKIVEEEDKLFLDDETNYLVCVPFFNINNRNSLKYWPPIKNVSVKSFLNYSIASIEKWLNVYELFNLNESYIFNSHVCFTITKRDLEWEQKPFNWFLLEYGFLNIFIYSKGKQPYFYETAYDKNDFMPLVYFVAYKQKVFNRNHLMNSGCLIPESQIKYNRGRCLNDCLVEKKVETSFYSINDSKLFDLNLIGGRERPLPVLNYESPGLRTKFKDCLKKCKEFDCFWEIVNTVKIDFFYYEGFLREEGEKNIHLVTNIYSAYYSTDDYYLQLFGLLSLFTGTSIVRLLPALLSLLVKKLKRHRSGYYKFFRIFRLVYPKIKFTICFLSFIFILNESLFMVNKFKFNSQFPNKTSSLKFINIHSNNNTFSLVVCFPIVYAFYRDENIIPTIKERNLAILRKFDLKSIEKATKEHFLSRFLDIFIISSDVRTYPKYNISNDVLFKSSKFKGETCLSRCFRIDFESKEIGYKTMMPLGNLRFCLGVLYKELFLIDKNQNFVSNLTQFRGVFTNQKVTKQFSKTSKKSNCRDYSKEHGCNSRKNCFDRCLSIEFLKKHGRIPAHTVVNLTSLPSFVLTSEIMFDESSDSLIEQQCSNQFKQRDCNEVYFEEGPELVNSQVDYYITLRLTYRNKMEIEMEYESAKTLLDIVSLASIFFGLNIRGTLATIIFVINQAFRIKFNKAYKVIIFLIAGIGFLIHNYLVFQSVVNANLNQYEFFEKPDQFILPSPVFCFPFSKDEFDENHRSTGEYMDELTKSLTFKNIFEDIVYYNRTHKKPLSLWKLNSTANSNFYSDPELRRRGRF